MGKIIFLGGEQGSGKSTAASFIADTLESMGESTYIMKFADTIYKFHNAIEAEFAEAAMIPKSPKRGKLLQILGTDIGREIYGEDIWVNLTKRRITDIWSKRPNEIIIVEDVRFDNELMLCPLLKSVGHEAISIYFEAPVELRKERVEGFRENTAHRSEAELSGIKDKFTHKVRTDRSMSEKNADLLSILTSEKLVPSPINALQSVVALFNQSLHEWSQAFGHGANFEWRYDDNGNKHLAVKDCAPINLLPKDLVAVQVEAVQNIMEKLDGQ